MKDICTVSPIKRPCDIENFANKTTCRDFYVYHRKFMNGNFEYIQKFIEIAKKNNAKIFINFKHDITEEDLIEIKKFIKYLKNTKIDGLFINSYAILEAIKNLDLPFKVIVDSYFDIHNLSGIEFANNFHHIDGIIITEEIYMKNIAKIKKSTNLPLAIDSDNLPWCCSDIKKLNAIDKVIIKGKFSNSDEILDGILLIEKMIKNPDEYKSHKLPFKHVRKSTYQTNHFSGDMLSAEGVDFKFSRNILKHKWDIETKTLDVDTQNNEKENIKINLRLTELAQVNEVKKFIDKVGYNPIFSMEYGEILSTADLSTSSFDEVIKKVKTFCFKNGMRFQLSTPRILIERDFDRVYEYVKSLILQEPYPSSLIINNIGYFWAVINDEDLSRIPIEIGQGINLLNSMSINCLNNIYPINTIDFTSFNDEENIVNTVKKIKNIIPRKKLTIAGNIRVPASGLCPLNNDSAIVSRLSCKAPCHKGHFALKDPSLDKIFPFTCDGFCRMHMFEDKILANYNKIDYFLKVGINEFVFDFSALDACYVQSLLTEFLNSRNIANKK